ncbi:TPR_1 domain-containing protein [Rhizoctonia solani AG-1 IA]|uniref:TPR_1 domain-containing protein n=1 Tax=Thanatephorus cucumeris (strain AG1-IA) TaxID=983506 RepID=L8X6A1_THACA|nr:TPR_1 domain-containing protein [Rhizoctonia solani AG-1 IA]
MTPPMPLKHHFVDHYIPYQKSVTAWPSISRDCDGRTGRVNFQSLFSRSNFSAYLKGVSRPDPIGCVSPLVVSALGTRLIPTTPGSTVMILIKSKVKHQGEVAACKIKVDTAEALGVAVHDTTPLVSLKAEASELFKSGDSKGAKRVYTRALAHTDLDPHEKAVLYCNRAAAEMKLRRFEDAIADSKRSVEADPNYSRGYERLATAQLVGCVPIVIFCSNTSKGLHRYNDAYESYGKAIALLDDISEPTSADIARKVKIEQALAEAQRKEAGPDVLLIRNATGSMPWDKAAGR